MQDTDIPPDATHSEFKMLVGARLARIRGERTPKITQKQVAGWIGVDQSAICAIEKGRNELTLYNARVICRKLGIHLSDLIGHQSDKIDFSKDKDLYFIFEDGLKLGEPFRSIFTDMCSAYFNGVRQTQGDYKVTPRSEK